jgi:hypothetical protein
MARPNVGSANYEYRWTQQMTPLNAFRSIMLCHERRAERTLDTRIFDLLIVFVTLFEIWGTLHRSCSDL